MIFAALFLIGCGKVRTESETVEDSSPLSEASLAMDSAAVVPGDAVEGAVVLTLAAGWHTYSDPPGDSGMAPVVEFILPPGWSASRLPLPPPRRFADPSGVTFGYEEELRIGFRIAAPPHAAAGETAEVKIDVQWLICQDICLAQSAQLKTVLSVGGQ